MSVKTGAECGWPEEACDCQLETAAPVAAPASNLEWAERELMKMHGEESDPQLRALWSTAARIARQRIAAKSPNAELSGQPPKT